MSPSAHSLSEFLTFCLVGGGGAFLDFFVFNFLSGRLHWKRISANLMSVVFAKVFNFTGNWFLVFHPPNQYWLTSATRFFLVSSFSAFFLQNLIIYATTHIWTSPGRLACSLARRAKFSEGWSEEFISRNTSKAMGVGVGIVWNFLWYKLYVFSDHV